MEYGGFALYCIEECRVILADIVVSRAVPKSPGEPIVIRDGGIREALELLRVIPSRVRPSTCDVSDPLPASGARALFRDLMPGQVLEDADQAGMVPAFAAEGGGGVEQFLCSCCVGQ